MTREELLEIGFEELPHFTIGRNLIYELGRDRHISISCVGTPNEMIYIGEWEGEINKELVVLRNYDFDGYTSTEQIKSIIKFFN